MLFINDLPEYITPQQIKQFLRIGQRQTYQLIKTKDFQNMKLPDINFFSKEKFINWLEGGILMNLKINKRGDKYTCVIDVGVNGERKQKRITRATKKEVKAAVLEIKSQLNRGTYTEPSKMLFSELTRMWLEQKEFEIR